MSTLEQRLRGVKRPTLSTTVPARPPFLTEPQWQDFLHSKVTTIGRYLFLRPSEQQRQFYSPGHEVIYVTLRSSNVRPPPDGYWPLLSLCTCDLDWPLWAAYVDDFDLEVTAKDGGCRYVSHTVLQAWRNPFA